MPGHKVCEGERWRREEGGGHRQWLGVAGSWGQRGWSVHSSERGRVWGRQWTRDGMCGQEGVGQCFLGSCEEECYCFLMRLIVALF
jgi:hypothetical protein